MSKSLPKGADYWKFGFMFFLFFAMDGTVIPYLSYWLHDVKHLDAYRIGVVFSVATAVALVLQPFVAVLTDKMDNRKQHVWVLIAAALFYAPFMVYGVNAAFGLSVWLAVVMYGLFIGFVSYTAGPFFEAYLEKAGRGSDIEYGQTRMFGAIGYGLAASLAGYLYNHNPNSIFWVCSGAALLLAVLFYNTTPRSALAGGPARTAVAPRYGVKTFLTFLRSRTLWCLMVWVVGAATLYIVFEQQFMVFFTSFFADKAQGVKVFGISIFLRELLVAFVMYHSPKYLNNIGGKNALIAAGFVMSIRMLLASLISNEYMAVGLLFLHVIEVPLILVGIFKYIEEAFGGALSGSAYLFGYVFTRSVAGIVYSPLVGELYERWGFPKTYQLMGFVCLLFTTLAIFTLSKKSRLPTQSPENSRA